MSMASPTAMKVWQGQQHALSSCLRQTRSFTITRYSLPKRPDENAAAIVNNDLIVNWPSDSELESRKLKSATVAQDESGSLDLKYEHTSEAVPVSTFWLRDSCQCPHCVSPSSGQKSFRSSDLPDRPVVKAASVDEDGTLHVEWAGETVPEGNDGSSTAPHVSTYASDTLLRRLCRMTPPTYPGLPERRFWNRETLERDLRPVAFEDWKDGNSPDFWRALLDLHQLGILIVDGVPQTETAVEEVANAIGHIQETFYGRTWDVVSKPEAENVAYTNVFLCLHHDLMYMNEPPYIQLLHCLQNECDGGESLFSDSIRTAMEIKMTQPDLLTALDWNVRYHYERNGHYYFCNRPIVRQSMGAITETSWSPPFQDHFPALLEGKGVTERVLRWRKAAKVFSDLCEAPENMYEVKMKPGQCVLFNNRRVLHGRQQFNTSQGYRKLKGTYIAEQTFRSKVMAMVREEKYAPALSPTGSRSRVDTQKLEKLQMKHLLGIAEQEPAVEN